MKTEFMKMLDGILDSCLKPVAKYPDNPQVNLNARHIQIILMRYKAQVSELEQYKTDIIKHFQIEDAMEREIKDLTKERAFYRDIQIEQQAAEIERLSNPWISVDDFGFPSDEVTECIVLVKVNGMTHPVKRLDEWSPKSCTFDQWPAELVVAWMPIPKEVKL